jgi:hypothetical protein
MRGLSILLLAGCAAPSEFRDRLLATLPEDVRVDVPVAFSLDGRRAAYVERASGVSRVVHDGRKERPFEIVC